MANKKLAEDIDEIKKALGFMSQEITQVATEQRGLKELLEEIKQLKKEAQEKDKKIEQLERRIDDLEQFSRKDDLLISGLEIKRSYAQAAARGGGQKNLLNPASSPELPTLEQQVIKFFDSNGITIDGKNIVACHTLPQRDRKKSNILIRFANRKHKMEVLRNGRKLKGTGVYVNEHLTKRNATIAREARILRKEKKIQDTWTRNCRVLIKLNGHPEETKVITVKDITELDQYK